MSRIPFIGMLLVFSSGSALAHPGHGAPAVHAHPPGTDDPLALVAWLVLAVVVVGALAWMLRKWLDRAP